MDLDDVFGRAGHRCGHAIGSGAGPVMICRAETLRAFDEIAAKA